MNNKRGRAVVPNKKKPSIYDLNFDDYTAEELNSLNPDDFDWTPPKCDYYKEFPSSKIWWLDNWYQYGEYVFSFDKKKNYNLFADYPHNMTKEEVEIFNLENPYWRKFFHDRFEDDKN